MSAYEIERAFVAPWACCHLLVQNLDSGLHTCCQHLSVLDGIVSLSGAVHIRFLMAGTVYSTHEYQGNIGA
eukprot:1486057-Amphidinium_carterae.1